MARNYKVSPQTVGLSSVQAFAFKRAGRKASHLTSLLHVRIRYSVQVPTVPPPLTTMTARPTLHPDSAFSSQFSAIARGVSCTYVRVGPYPAISTQSGAPQLQVRRAKTRSGYATLHTVWRGTCTCPTGNCAPSCRGQCGLVRSACIRFALPVGKAQLG